MTLLAPLGALALLALPLIAALYFLKVRRPEVRVATLLFWRRQLLDRQANAPWQRLRAGLLLFLQLLAASAIAVALLRPGVSGAAGIGATTVVLLDGSASMQATDVSPTRFGAAVRRARELAGQLGAGQEMALILLGEHARLLSPPTGDAGVLGAALDRAQPGGAGADLGEGISLANAILAGRGGGSIILLGDGHARQPASPPRLAAPLSFQLIGAGGENAALEALTLAPGNLIFMRVANYGRQARELRIEMIADGRAVDVLPARVEGNSSTDLSWSRLPAGTQVLEARLTPGDAFPLDDRAWLVTSAPQTRSVLLVTAENGFLERALRLRPGVRLSVVKPQDYRSGDSYDLYVFDGFVPPGRLPEPALVVAPPLGSGPVPAGPAVDPGGVLPANQRDPLLRDVNLRDVHVQVASKVAVPGDWRVAMAAAGAPLLLVHEGEPRLAELTFDLHHSDLPLRAAFPILVQNLSSYLLPGGYENQVFAPGSAVGLGADPQARSITVTTPEGRSQRLLPPYPPFTDTARSGVYTVDQQLPGSTRTGRFVVQLQDRTQSQILPGAAPVTQEAAPTRGPGPRGTLELWPWLAGLALVLLTTEWIVFLRPRAFPIP